MATAVAHISIDRFGRVVLPKSVRDRLGIRPGTEFQLEETEDAILLKPVIKKARLVEKEGLLVADLGEPVSRETVRETLEKVRRERGIA